MVTIDISRPFSLCTLESNLPTTKKNPGSKQKHNWNKQFDVKMQFACMFYVCDFVNLNSVGYQYIALRQFKW